MKMLVSLALALGLATPALTAGTYSYNDFEVSVNHIDLEECPDGLADGDVFCRVTMMNDAMHVYVFENEGERLFVSVHTFYEDEFNLELSQ